MSRDQADQPKKPVTFSYEVFLARLHHWAAERCGIEVTERIVRDWCEEKLLPGPTRVGLGRGKGFRNDWDSLNYRRACRIIRFKKHGATRFDEFRILLWLSGEHVNIRELRKACLGELSKYRSSVSLSTRSNVDLTDPEPSPRTIKAFERRGAEADRRIVPANFKYGGQGTMEMLAVLKTSEVRISFAESLVDGLGLPVEVQLYVKPIVELFRGLLSDPEDGQISSQKSIEFAEPAHFKLARDELRKIIQFGRFFRNNIQKMGSELPSNTELAPVANSYIGLEQREFKVLMFLTMVAVIKRNEWPLKKNPAS